MKFLLLIKSIGCSLQSFFLLAIRLYWGYQFAIAGYGKFLHLDKTTEFFTSIGIPFPFFNVLCASSVELIGGALLFLGLFSRLASIPLLFVMGVAYLTTEQPALSALFTEFDPDPFFRATPFLFLYASLIVFCFGPGKISCDHFINNEQP